MSKPYGRIKDTTRAVQSALVSQLFSRFYLIAVAKFPFLAWPVVSSIFESVVKRFLIWLTDEEIIFFNTVWIRVNVSGDAAALEEARQKAIRAVEEGASDEELDKRDEELRDALDELHRRRGFPI